MTRSFVGISIQLGLLRHTGVVIGVPKFALAIGSCERAMNAASAPETSAAKHSWNRDGSREVKPSFVVRIAVERARSLGKRLPSAASLSPASGMWAAKDTSPTTAGCVPASVITEPP